MIAFRNFALRRGERLLLSEVDLALHAGWRIGVVGRNGTGKSSLFAAVRGEIEADRGDLDLPSKLRIASVAQETPSLPDPAIEFVLGGDEVVAAVIRAEAEATAREDWEAVAAARGHDLMQLASTGRSGPDSRRTVGEIGFHALRGGSVVGEHTVVFASDQERIELFHRAEGREVFAAGALTAARWLATRAPGRYRIEDLLGALAVPAEWAAEPT